LLLIFLIFIAHQKSLRLKLMAEPILTEKSTIRLVKIFFEKKVLK